MIATNECLICSMKIEKEILSFSADQKIVKFYDIQSYYFKYGQSKGQLFQQVYVINFPAFVSKLNKVWKKIAIKNKFRSR